MFHAAGQAIKSLVFGEGESEEQNNEAEPVDRDLREKGSEEPETGHYWSPSSRKVVNETLAAEDILSPDKLSRQPNYKSGDSVTLARPSPSANKLSRMPRPFKGIGKPFQPHNSLNGDPINPIRAAPGSFRDGIPRARKPAQLITSNTSPDVRQPNTITSSMAHTSNNEDEGPPHKKQRTIMIPEEAQPDELVDLAIHGIVKPVQKSSRRSRITSDNLETQKQHVRQQQPRHRPRLGNMVEDENRGDGFDLNNEVKQVMTPNGLSPSVPSQIISGNSHDLQRVQSSTATKSRPRDRGGTSRSISKTLNGTDAGDTAMEDVASALPSRPKKKSISKSEQSKAGQHVDQSEESEEEDGNLMNTSGRHVVGLLRSFYDVHGNNVSEPGMYFYMNRTEAHFEVVRQRGPNPNSVPFAILLKLISDTTGSGIACVLEGSQVHVEATDSRQAYWVALTFQNHDGLRKFRANIAEIRGGVKLVPKSEDWIQKTIRKKRSEQDENIKNKKSTQEAWTNKLSRKQNDTTPLADSNITEPPLERSMAESSVEPRAGDFEVRQSLAKDTHHPNTPKLRNRMQGDGDEISNTTRKKLHSTDSNHTPTMNESSSRPRRACAEGQIPHVGSDTDSTPPARTTRSSGKETTKQNSTRQVPEKKVSARALFDDTDFAECPWKDALLYPSKGPGRATVEFADLERLDDEAYLNDNLISFGLRYLQEQYPATKSKVYIFNSFFYNTLAGKGRKDIDYDAVKRWTSKVDLFSYDHVVVPINAGMHWYWAIICNIHNVFAVSENDTKQESMVDEQAEKLVGLSITTDHEEVTLRSSRKNDPTIPTIVTLDSLHNPHSPVIGNLKKYVSEEAKSKKGKEVDQSFIKGRGMTSKEIPSQVNLTDCGLHLIITIGELLKSPDEFVAKLIGKSFNNEKDFAGWEDMSAYREHWLRVVLNEYNNQTGGDYYTEVAKVTAELDNAEKLKRARASKANPPFVPPKILGKLPPSTSSSASFAKQRSASPSKSARMEVSNPINKLYKTPVKPEQPTQLASAEVHELTDSDEDMSSSPVRPLTTEMPSTQSPPTASHVTDKLASTLEPKEVKVDADTSDFVADSQPESGPVPSQDKEEVSDELAVIEKDAHPNGTAQRYDSQSPAEQTIVLHAELEEQDGKAKTSSNISQTPTTPARIVKKVRKSIPHHSHIINLDESQDVEQDVFIADTLNNLVDSLGTYQARDTTSLLSRTNDIFSQDLPFGFSNNHKHKTVLDLASTQGSDELGEPHVADASGLLGALRGGIENEMRQHVRAQDEEISVEKVARAAEGRRQEHPSKRRHSNSWPTSPRASAPRAPAPRAPAPRAPSPEL